MKKIAMAVLISLLALAALPCWAADQRDFNVINSSGFPIKFIGINPPGDEIWNENELNAVLPDQAQLQVRFSGADKGCGWNMKVTWADDNRSQIFRGLDLCHINAIRIIYDSKSDEAFISME
jgi:hypothetical protein